MSDLWKRAVSWLVGAEGAAEISEVHLGWGAGWASRQPLLVGLTMIAAFWLAVWFYRRRQPIGRGRGLATMRGIALSLLVVVMADPVWTLQSRHEEKPLLWMLVDSSESMNLPSGATESSGERSRIALWNDQISQDDRLRTILSERFRTAAFSFAGIDEPRPVDWREPLSLQPNARSGRTAIGSALDQLRQRAGGRAPAGLIVVSDFVQNAGPAALEAARKWESPVFAVGLGPAAAADVSAELDADSVVKQGERTTARATVRHSGLDGREVSVRLTSQPAEGDPSSETRLLGRRRIVLDEEATPIEFPITPERAGRMRLQLELRPLPGEALTNNNRASREIMVTDEFLRVLFVEYEPTWEWRFVKEVLHRDRLVGRDDFRTYLRSSDPAVRQKNDLFLLSLPPPRAEFFRYDVVILGDVPASALPGRFAEMTREFVSEFGGGLVVTAGPRFGPAALADTPIANMLPVTIDPAAGRHDESFRPALTSAAEEFDFMRLGDTQHRHSRAWNNLGELPWYQPVRRLESTSVALATHPRHTTSNGQTKQPLIAHRAYGAAGGEVVYLGFNETWRLRRLYGEKYHRRFWAQLIHRLGLNHARGADKRFVIDPLPSEPIEPGESLSLVVRAWDENFEQLGADDLSEDSLSGELVLMKPGRERSRPVALSVTRPGVFETSVSVEANGRWRFRVRDPVTKRVREAPFRVAHRSLERRVSTRNAALQRRIAALDPQGRTTLPEELGRQLAEFDPPRRVTTKTTKYPLVPTWPMFVLVATLLLGEWSLRKWRHLA